MKWTVGMDLRPSSHGAIRYARWLHTAAPGEHFDGVHVVESLELPKDIAELDGAARRATERVVERLECKHVFNDVVIAGGDAPEGVIRAAAEERSASAILIGRQGAHSDSSDRLGRVARRLLRTLPTPVVVTRPDLTEDEVGKGAVVVATDLQPSSVAALHFGHRVAKKLGRELVVAHVHRHPSHTRVYLPETDWSVVTEDMDARAQREAETWAQFCEGNRVRVVVDEGPTVRRVLSIAAAEDACLIVCGASKGGAQPDNWISSVGTELAKVFRGAVAVVPPGWEEDEG